MIPRARNLVPVFAPLWACVAAFAVWQTTVRNNDTLAAIGAGALLAGSILFSRFVLKIPLASGSLVYLILLGVFHLGLIVPWAMGVYDLSRQPSFVPYGLSRAIALIDYAIVAYQAGLLVASGRRRQTSAAEKEESESENAEVYVCGLIWLAAGIAMFLTGLIGLDPLGFFHLTYSETFQLRAESDPRLFGSGITVAFIGLTVAAAGASARRFKIVAVVGTIWLAGLLYWGFRGPALIAITVVYITARKKGLRIPRWVPLLAAASLLFIIPILRVGRELPLQERFARASWADFHPLDAPAEMGMSIRPLIETVELLGPHDFRWGKTYWIALKGVVPNLAIHWEAAAAGNEEDLPPSHWITAMVDPWAYKHNGGIGFSAIAEPYMNFGVAGVLFFFLALAMGLVYLDRISLRGSYALAAWGLILGPLLWTTRNDFSNFFRPAVWGLLSLLLVKSASPIYSRIFRKRKTAVARPLTA